MNFFRKNAQTIIAFITGAVLIGGISTYAAYNYYASQVSYTKPGTETKISVEEALNDLYSKSKSDKTLLWTNPNPNSNFGETTLNLDLSRYKYIIIITKADPVNPNEPSYESINIVPVTRTDDRIANGGSFAVRRVTTTSSTVWFSVATFGSESPMSDRVIPLYIYGTNFDFGL